MKGNQKGTVILFALLLVVGTFTVVQAKIDSPAKTWRFVFEPQNETLCGETRGNVVFSYTTRAYCTCPDGWKRIEVGTPENNWYCTPGELCAVPYSCQK